MNQHASLSFNLIGDLYLPDHIKKTMVPKTLESKFLEADFNLANLEAPFFQLEEARKSKFIIPAHKIQNINFLSQNNISIVSLANNHIFDYGYTSYVKTQDLLKKNNIRYFGGGANLASARQPLIVTMKGVQIGFLGYSWSFIESIDARMNGFGVAPLRSKVILEDIQTLRSQCDLVIVSVHWGFCNEIYPIPYQKKLAQQCIDHGADIIVGQHPHVLQGYECYNNKFIFYSLGNFIFPEFQDLKDFSEEEKEAMVISMRYQNKKLAIVKKEPLKFIDNNYLSSENCEHIKIKFQNLSKVLCVSHKEYTKFFRQNRKVLELPVIDSECFANCFQVYFNLRLKCRNLLYALGLLKYFKYIRNALINKAQ